MAVRSISETYSQLGLLGRGLNAPFRHQTPDQEPQQTAVEQPPPERIARLPQPPAPEGGLKLEEARELTRTLSTQLWRAASAAPELIGLHDAGSVRVLSPRYV